MAITIDAAFTLAGAPATGLTPTLNARRVSDGVLVVTAGAMPEVGAPGDGSYAFDFASTIDFEEEYTFRADGSAVLSDGERFKFGSISGPAVLAELVSLYQGRVWINTLGAGNPGVVLGVNGTEPNPVDNLAEALTIAAALGLRTLDLCGSITLTGPFENFQVFGNCRVPSNAVVNLAGQSIDDSFFVACQLDGVSSGRVTAWDCQFATVGAFSVAGTLVRCRFDGQTFTPLAGASQLIDCVSTASIGARVIDFTNDPQLAITGYQGALEFQNLAGGLITVTLVGDRLVLGPTNTSGTVTASGIAELEDTSGAGLTVDATALVLQSEIADLFDWRNNRLEVDFAVTPRLATLYERDTITIKKTQELKTEGGEAVGTSFGVQTKRGAST